jgi:hypothetical protein
MVSARPECRRNDHGLLAARHRGHAAGVLPRPSDILGAECRADDPGAKFGHPMPTTLLIAAVFAVCLVLPGSASNGRGLDHNPLTGLLPFLMLMGDVALLSETLPGHGTIGHFHCGIVGKGLSHETAARHRPIRTFDLEKGRVPVSN